MKRMGISINIEQRMMEGKLNFFSDCQMSNDRLIKQVVFGIMDGKNKSGRPKKIDRRLSGLVQQGYRHPVQIGDGQNEMESFREICHRHQRALSHGAR